MVNKGHTHAQMCWPWDSCLRHPESWWPLRTERTHKRFGIRLAQLQCMKANLNPAEPGLMQTADSSSPSQSEPFALKDKTVITPPQSDSSLDTTTHIFSHLQAPGAVLKTPKHETQTQNMLILVYYTLLLSPGGQTVSDVSLHGFRHCRVVVHKVLIQNLGESSTNC